MTTTPPRYVETHLVLAIGKRLGLLLLGMAVYCGVCGLLIHGLPIRVPDWGSAASVIDTVILSLLMSFRNRVAYDRWWEARGLWGQLTLNDSRNLAAKVAAFVPAEAVARSRLGELLATFPEALKRHLRDQAPRLRDLPGFEHESAEPAHVPLYLVRCLYDEVADWQRAGQLETAVLWILDAHLRGLLDVCGGCEKIRNTPLSPSYKTLLRAGLILNVLAAPWLAMSEVGFWAVPAIELVCFFLLGVELIDSVVEEPFGRERDDLDLDRYCRTIRDGVSASLPLASKASPEYTRGTREPS